MPSRITIKDRIENAHSRGENNLNLSFEIKDLYNLMELLDVKDTDGTDLLANKIVKKILG